MSVDPFGARFGGGLDDLFTRFFGGRDPFATVGFGSRDPVGSPAVQRVDLSRLLDDAARELLSWAASAAAEWGSPDLDTEHLLWAATQLPQTRELLVQAGVDVDALARRAEEAVEHGPPGETVPPLTPAAERALLDAHRQAQAAGSRFIGAEHMLLGLGANPDAAAARLLARALPAPNG